MFFAYFCRKNRVKESMNTKIMIIAVLFFALFSCSESLEERAFREAKEFTKKNCPVPLSQDLTIDSMTFNKLSRTFTYYYSLSPKVDADNLKRADTEQLLLVQLRNQTSLRKYKEAGYAFRYIYYPLVKPSRKVIDVTFKKEDYSLTPPNSHV